MDRPSAPTAQGPVIDMTLDGRVLDPPTRWTRWRGLWQALPAGSLPAILATSLLVLIGAVLLLGFLVVVVPLALLAGLFVVVLRAMGGGGPTVVLRRVRR